MIWIGGRNAALPAYNVERIYIWVTIQVETRIYLNKLDGRKIFYFMQSDEILQFCLKNLDGIDIETKLARVSDKLWEIGNLEEIKEKVSSDLFYLHVGINMIGMWKGEGWWGIIAEQADFVPYIPITLEKLNLTELKIAFENIIKLFPEYTVFKSDDKAYYDIVNFLQNANLKVDNERLQSISLEERRKMVKELHKNLDILEDLSEPFWRDSAECGGWKQILDFLVTIQNRK